MPIQSGKDTREPLIYVIDVTGSSSSSNVFANTANPFGVDVIIIRAVLRVATQSTGAATVDIGVGATSSTADDTLIDGLSVAAAGSFDNITDKGTNGKASKLWTSTQYVTVKEASGDVDGLVAKLYLEVIPY